MKTFLSVALLAALVSAAVGTFLTYSDDPPVPLPIVEVPDDTAVRALQATAEAAPQDPAAWQELGLAATQQAIATADPAWYTIASNAFDQAVALDPDDPRTTIARGRLELSLHDFTVAKELGEAATQALPDNADAWGVLVDAHVELGEYDAAADALQTMLDLRPDLAALARASYLRQLNGDLDGAIVAMRQADVAGGTGSSGSTGAPASVVAGLLGDLLLQRGDLDGAAEAYARTATPAGAAGLARIAAAEGDLERAASILLDLVERIPSPPIIQVLAEVQQRAQDTEGLAETVALARTVATLQQASGQTVDLELAIFEASFGDAQAAVELAEQSYAARPDNVYAVGALAWASHQAGSEDRARELAAQATRLGTVDTAHELRMAQITGRGMDELLARNPLAEELYLP